MPRRLSIVTFLLLQPYAVLAQSSFDNVALVGVIREAEDEHLSVALIKYGEKTATLKIGDVCPWDKSFFLAKINVDSLSFADGKREVQLTKSPWDNSSAKYEDSEIDRFYEHEENDVLLQDDKKSESKNDVPMRLDIKDDDEEAPASIEELIELLSTHR